MHVTSAETTFPFQYAKIKNFYIYKDYKIFIAQKLNVIGSNTHIRGMQVELIEDEFLMTCTVMEFFI